MAIKSPKQRTWTFASLAVASLLTLGACADVDMQGEALADEELEQLGTPDETTADPTAPGAAPRADLGAGNGQDVITIGDSWMVLLGRTSGIHGALTRAGKRYRGYGAPATQLLTGQIPSQFDRAVRENKNISTVIMTGGGNDVLLTGASLTCRDVNCQQLKNIVTGLKRLWERMAAAGVKDVVYVGYAEGAGSTPAAVTNTMKNGSGAACQAMTTLRCHPIDSTPVINGARGLSADGIHPTPASNDRIAKAVVELMEKEGIRR